MTNFLNILQI